MKRKQNWERHNESTYNVSVAVSKSGIAVWQSKESTKERGPVKFDMLLNDY